ncbi:hypothetical protein COB21_04815, partial [Candidatus Aerophobetes bacterium]
MKHFTVPQKAHLFLIFSAAIFLLILVRIFYLSTFMHSHYLAKAQKPQHSIQSIPALRGEIYDCFGHSLAANQLQYNATIIYDDIRQIPRVKWQKKEKIYARKNYITKLAKTLSLDLNYTATEIEDMIHAKAAIFPSTPCILESDVDEQTYHRLKMLERLLPGLYMQKGVTRVYPYKKTAGSVIGYLGAINQSQYYQISLEIKDLKAYLKAISEGIPTPLPVGFDSLKQVSDRYDFLLEKVYTMNTRVGKFGLEKALEKELRGSPGKASFLLGRGGSFLGSLPLNKNPIPGKNITLSLSIELQEFAEKLLTYSESVRRENFASFGKNHQNIQAPWIKGGAIVAMKPQTGEIVAMASLPRLDPNDFILSVNKKEKKRKNLAIEKWIESRNYTTKIFNGFAPLEKEILPRFGQAIKTEFKRLSWDLYLNTILSKKSAVRALLHSRLTLKESLALQQQARMLTGKFRGIPLKTLFSALFKGEKNILTLDQKTEAQKILAPLKPYLSPVKHPRDQCLFLDLLRLNCNACYTHQDKIGSFSSLTLSQHHDLRQAFCKAQEVIKNASLELFHTHCFEPWRKSHFSHYLSLKRKEEKKAKRSAKPYTKHLEFAKKQLFNKFWNKHKWSLIRSYLLEDLLLTDHLKVLSFHLLVMSKSNKCPKIRALKMALSAHPMQHALAYLKSIEEGHTMDFALYTDYPSLYPSRGQKGSDLCRAFFPKYGFGYAKPFTYAQPLPTGSIFKVVTAYQALLQSGGENPYKPSLLTLIDQSHKDKTSKSPMLGKWLDGTSIPRYYKGGRLPKSHRSFGLIDLSDALAKSSNLYFSILASDYIASSSQLIETAKNFGFGEKTGVELLGESRGNLPTDLRENKTGLYAFSIGQHTLLSTPLQTAVCLNTLTNNGYVIKPTLIKEKQTLLPSLKDLNENTTFPFR